MASLLNSIQHLVELLNSAEQKVVIAFLNVEDKWILPKSSWGQPYSDTIAVEANTKKKKSYKPISLRNVHADSLKNIGKPNSSAHSKNLHQDHVRCTLGCKDD